MAANTAIPSAWAISTVLRSRLAARTLTKHRFYTDHRPTQRWNGFPRTVSRLVCARSGESEDRWRNLPEDMEGVASKLDASFFAGAMPKEEIGALRFLKVCLGSMLKMTTIVVSDLNVREECEEECVKRGL